MMPFARARLGAEPFHVCHDLQIKCELNKMVKVLRLFAVNFAR